MKHLQRSCIDKYVQDKNFYVLKFSHAWKMYRPFMFSVFIYRSMAKSDSIIEQCLNKYLPHQRFYVHFSGFQVYSLITQNAFITMSLKINSVQKVFDKLIVRFSQASPLSMKICIRKFAITKITGNDFQIQCQKSCIWKNKICKHGLGIKAN